eukprot:1792610-Alexandrium_andersonii.AAC.1
MVTTKQAGGRARDAFRGGPGGRGGAPREGHSHRNRGPAEGVLVVFGSKLQSIKCPLLRLIMSCPLVGRPLMCGTNCGAALPPLA